MTSGLGWILGKISSLECWSGLGTGCPGQWWSSSLEVFKREHFQSPDHNVCGCGTWALSVALVRYRGLTCCAFPSQGHNQLHEQQHRYQQTSGDAAAGRASESVRLPHRQGGLQDQGDPRGKAGSVSLWPHGRGGAVLEKDPCAASCITSLPGVVWLTCEQHPTGCHVLGPQEVLGIRAGAGSG